MNRTCDRNFRAGAAAVKKGRYQQALKPLRKALKAVPRGPGFDWQRGAVH